MVQVDIIKRPAIPMKNWLIDWQHIWQDAKSEEQKNYFLSWAWIEQLLKSVPNTIEINLAQIVSDKNTAACLFGYAKERRHQIFISNSYYLNYTGHHIHDNLTLEYNKILSTNPSPEVLKAILKALPKNWDEVHLPALDLSSFPADHLEYLADEYRIITKREEKSYYVDLQQLDSSPDTFLNTLSKTVRSRITRSLKKLAQLGKVCLVPATNVEHALALYDDLVALHQLTWQKRGHPGAFATPWIYEFHRNLIKNRFEYGEIQLVRAVCADKTIGCLYNFVHNGTVFHYQSGINYNDFKKYGPGIICNSLTIAYNAGLGNKVYDFLAGEDEYKQALSNHFNKIRWCVIQKPRLRFQIEDTCRKIKRWLLP